MHFILIKYGKLATILSKGGNMPPVLGCLMSSLCQLGWCDPNSTNPILVPLPGGCQGKQSDCCCCTFLGDDILPI